MTTGKPTAGRVSRLDRPFFCLSLRNLIRGGYAVNLTRERTSTLVRSVIDFMGGSSNLMDNPDRGAAFVVLKTATMPAMGSTLGKGLVLLVTNDSTSMSARVVTIVAVYSAIGLRDSQMNERVGKALMGGSQKWQAVKHLRRDPHEPSDACWLHGPTCCFSTLA